MSQAVIVSLSNEDLILLAAEALNPQQLSDDVWVADVAAAVEAANGEIFTGACVGGYLSICAEQSALSQMVARIGPVVTRVVAVWRDEDGVLHVLPPCGRCREFLRTLTQDNLEAQVILGPQHVATLRELLPYPGWYAEKA